LTQKVLQCGAVVTVCCMKGPVEAALIAAGAD
jgi:hypothetical protein